MCYVRRTRYSCTHLSPYHAPKDQLPNPDEQPTPYIIQRQANPRTEWPTHHHTTLVGCQDCGRRGERCPDPLERLETVITDREGLCDECKKKGKGEVEGEDGEKIEVKEEGGE